MADRKLDVLIATEVLGYEAFSPWEGVFFMASSIEAIDKARFYDRITEFAESQPDGSVEFCYELPYFDRIAGAWQIVEKLQNSNYCVEIMAENGGGFTCEIWEDKGEMWLPVSEADGETAPLAICQAVCKAMGIESEDETDRQIQGQLRELEIGV